MYSYIPTYTTTTLHTLLTKTYEATVAYLTLRYMHYLPHASLRAPDKYITYVLYKNICYLLALHTNQSASQCSSQDLNRFFNQIFLLNLSSSRRDNAMRKYGHLGVRSLSINIDLESKNFNNSGRTLLIIRNNDTRR